MLVSVKTGNVTVLFFHRHQDIAVRFQLYQSLHLSFSLSNACKNAGVYLYTKMLAVSYIFYFALYKKSGVHYSNKIANLFSWPIIEKAIMY